MFDSNCPWRVGFDAGLRAFPGPATISLTHLLGVHFFCPVAIKDKILQPGILSVVPILQRVWVLQLITWSGWVAAGVESLEGSRTDGHFTLQDTELEGCKKIINQQRRNKLWNKNRHGSFYKCL